MRRLLRFVIRPAVLAPLAVLLIASSIGAYAMRDRPQAKPTPPAAAVAELGDHLSIAKPDHARPTPTPTPTPKLEPPKPTPKPTPKKTVAAAPKPKGPSLSAFKKLGAWVDLYDYAAIDPEPASADMAARGVKTLYLQTARWNKPAPDDPNVFQDMPLAERWVHAAHANGMKIVGWYLPAYEDMGRDVTRTKAIATYRTSAGQRFDALAIDIEYKGQMSSLSEWNAAIVEHIRRVRSKVGAGYPIGAIVPSALAMEIYPQNWVGFPWKSIAAYANVFMPMAYWSYRHDCDSKPEHCAYGYTAGNVQRVRELTEKPGLPVHVIGGVADTITTQEVSDFVKAALAVKVYGASLYDYRTTKAEYWAPLQKLNV
ncbi:MAG: hypothetical protein WEB06_15005 [Actinomycetota bacterium]